MGHIGFDLRIKFTFLICIGKQGWHLKIKSAAESNLCDERLSPSLMGRCHTALPSTKRPQQLLHLILLGCRSHLNLKYFHLENVSES